MSWYWPCCCCGESAEFTYAEGGEVFLKPTTFMPSERMNGTSFADRNLLALIYERTLLCKPSKVLNRRFLFTATNSRLHSRAQPSKTQRYAKPVKARTFSQFFLGRFHLVEEAEELASNVLAASLLVVHDTSGGGQDDVTELTGGKELGSPLLEVTELDGVAGVDDTTLVETGGKKVRLMFHGD